MTINQISKVLFGAARGTRWAQAVKRSIEEGTPEPFLRRVGRVLVSRETGKAINEAFRERR